MKHPNTFLTSQDGSVVTLTLHRPQALNALTEPMVEQLTETFARLDSDDSVRALLLTGSGRGFCAGADVREMLGAETGLERFAGETDEVIANLHTMLGRLHGLSKPVVCAVNGACAGAGLGLALACDVTWAARSASFQTAFVGVGLSPDSGTSFFLPRAVGSRMALELFMTNRRLSGEEAAALGLVTRVLPDDELLEQATALARQLAAGPLDVFPRARYLVDTSLGDELEQHYEREREQISITAKLPAFAEGVHAFAEKRMPDFEAAARPPRE